MTTATLRLSIDTGPVLDAVSAFAELAESSPEIREAAVDVVDRLAEFVRLDLDHSPAANARELRIRLELADLLRALAAALRARNVDRRVVE